MDRILFDPWPGTATEADLLRLVERDKRLCELIDGTLVEKPVGYLEALIAMRLGAKLTAWADANDAGFVSGPDSTLRMASGRVRLPDVAFVSRARLPGGLVPRERVPALAPDLAVEVLSESNTEAEIDQKLTEYFQSGTRLAWVIDPRNQTVEVYHAPGEPTRLLGPADHFDGEQVLPGFTLPVADLFRNISPTP
jgi:Uma2 family endonuclease